MSIKSRSLIAVLLIVPSASGCSLFSPASPQTTADVRVDRPDEIFLAYRTDSSRLNSAAPVPSADVHEASYPTGGASGGVPAFTTSTLQLRYPHPAGNPDLALATVIFRSGAESGDSTFDAGRIWEVIAGTSASDSEQHRGPRVYEEWSMDIPYWQLEAVVSELRKAQFFKRARVLYTEANLFTQIDGKKFSKDYKKIDELDALILRSRSRGRLVSVGSSGTRPETSLASAREALNAGTSTAKITRLPPVTTK